MKHFLVLILAAVSGACSHNQATAPTKFICITALGPVQLSPSSDGGDVKDLGDRLEVTQDTEILVVSKSMCVGIREK